ncbi:hypothetical protein ACQEVS_25040 [Streptomyces sp. CA-181903]|uniref:hypothetical protein n=1 Tax=Streptomyces sp. CA-181903 TaxID=3240055 RepID=UPI003D9008EC
MSAAEVPGCADVLDGQSGTRSWRVHRRALRHDWGRTGAVDGVVGSGTGRALRRRMRGAGRGCGGAVSGTMGGAMGGVMSGVVGPETGVAFQRFAGACVTGCRQGIVV